MGCEARGLFICMLPFFWTVCSLGPLSLGILRRPVTTSGLVDGSSSLRTDLYLSEGRRQTVGLAARPLDKQQQASPPDILVRVHPIHHPQFVAGLLNPGWSGPLYPSKGGSGAHELGAAWGPRRPRLSCFFTAPHSRPTCRFAMWRVRDLVQDSLGSG